MTFKKWMALAMIIALLLTGVIGCGKSGGTEEGAVADEYVESDPADTPDVPQDAPVKVENPEGVTPDEPKDDPEEDPKEDPKDDPEEQPGESTDEPSNTPSEEPSDPGEDEPEVKYDEKNKLKIVSYNVRYTDDGENKMIADRAPRLQKLMGQLDPDLMGFQEVTPTWRGILDGYFSEEYEYAYKERFTNDECSPIFWKKDKFEKVKEGHFWLSDTPDEATRGWDGTHYRICTWVKLKVKATGAEFLYFNSHWDGTETCHVNSATLTLERARKEGAFEKHAMFLTADFNMIPGSKGYNTLVETLELMDVNASLQNDHTSTVNGYNDGSSQDRIIDMCFYSYDKAVPISYKVLNEEIDGGYISDHRGLLVEVAVL